MSDLAYLSWLSAAQLIRRGEMSSTEYVSALLERIDACDRHYDTFLTLLAEPALEAARQVDESVMKGRVLGPMSGVPFALKDIVDTAGVRTTCHSRILEDNVPGADAEVARRLADAGGILLGKLATHEFAIGGPSFDLPWPPARNAWNRDHFPGGSSSGSGAAVAAGFVPMAIGTDTAGSVRNPAAMNGIVGLKPTYGLVSRRGVFPLSFSLDHVGPMTRTVAENAAMLDVIAGHDPLDPASAKVETSSASSTLEQGVEGMRIGLLRHFYTRDQEAHPVVVSATDAAAAVFEGLGATVEEVETRPLAEFIECNRVLLMSEAYAVHEEWLESRPGDYGALARERLAVGGFLRAVDYVQCMRRRRQLRSEIDGLFGRFDVLLSASSMDPPPRIDDPGEIDRTYQRQARAPFNLSGHPALAVPGGFTADGLPLGFQLVGPAFAEATLYRAAHAYEVAAGWCERRPVLAGEA